MTSEQQSAARELRQRIMAGQIDYITGEEFGASFGKPTTGYAPPKVSKRKNHIWGVQKYLFVSGIPDPKLQWELIMQFVISREHKATDLKQCCDFIQKDFTSFTKYIKKQLTT